jgi:hypothetical protein
MAATVVYYYHFSLDFLTYYVDRNGEADKLANDGARKSRPDDIDIMVPDDFNVLKHHGRWKRKWTRPSGRTADTRTSENPPNEEYISYG